MKNLQFIICFILISYASYAQVEFSGIVTNQKNKPLANANVLLVPIEKENKMAFSIVKDDGTFKAYLNSNSTYKLTISFIGYKSFNDTIHTKESNIVLNKSLIEDLNELQEVTINYKPPVIIKKDTTIYDVSKFSNGKERKLKEVLKKLPGVEVDRKGNVTHNGKKVTKVLVEDKQFFTGQSKMAVDNIPADVVAEIEMIDDYHETAFLKGLEDSSELAMNIKLKEGKKDFLFGDIEAGTNLIDRYVLHPSIFKYGPKATYNFIGDLNNTAQKSFSLSDYIGFEGGLTRENSSSILRSDVTKLLRNDNFNDNIHQFGGLNFHLNPNEKIEIRSFIIALSDKSNFKNQNTFEYIEDNTVEFRNNHSKNNNTIFLGKINFKFNPNSKTSIKFENNFENTSLGVLGFNSSFFDNTLNLYNQNNNNTSKKYSLNLIAEKQFSKFHTSSLKLYLNTLDIDELSIWNSFSNLFSPVFPIIEDSFYDINQITNNNQTDINYQLKHYWVINRKNHLYAATGGKLIWQDIKGASFQNLSNSETNNFSDFKNELNSNLYYGFTSLEYKRIIWDVILQAKLQYEFYNWKNLHLTDTISNTELNVLPEVKLTYDIDNKKSIKIIYKQSSNLVNFENFISNNKINSFNSVFIGNQNLSLDYYHRFTLSYSNFKTYGFSYFPSIAYRKQKNAVVKNMLLNGIYSVSSPFNLNNANEGFNIRMRTLYNKPYWKATLIADYDNTKLNSFLNNNEITNTMQTLNGIMEFNTKFEEFPNIDLSLRSSIYFNKNKLFNNTLHRNTFYSAITYDLKDWQFKIDYEKNYFKNEYTFTTSSNFENLNTSIFYRKENSPFGFELRLANATNNKFRINSSYNSTVLQEEKTFIFPRTILFLLSYKL